MSTIRSPFKVCCDVFFSAFNSIFSSYIYGVMNKANISVIKKKNKANILRFFTGLISDEIWIVVMPILSLSFKNFSYVMMLDIFEILKKIHEKIRIYVDVYIHNADVVLEKRKVNSKRRIHLFQ